MHVRRQVVDEELQRALGRRHPGAARPADEQRHVGLLLQVAGLAHEFEMPERAGLEALAFELDLVLLGGLGIGDQLLDRMDRHHPLRRQGRHRLEIFVVGVEGDRHHVGAELHQLDLLLDARRRHAVLHDRIDLAHDRCGAASSSRRGGFSTPSCRRPGSILPACGGRGCARWRRRPSPRRRIAASRRRCPPAPGRGCCADRTCASRRPP